MRINLLPLEYRPKPFVSPGSFVILLVGGILFLAALGFMVVQYFEYQDLSIKLAGLKQQRPFYDSQMAEVKQLELQEEQVKKLLNEIKIITEMYPAQLVMVRNIAAVQPGEIWLEGIAIDGAGKIAIKGKALTIKTIGMFLNKLNQSEFFQSSRLEDLNRYQNDKYTSYSFNIVIESGRDPLEYTE